MSCGKRVIQNTDRITFTQICYSLKKNGDRLQNKPMVILDVGCGRRKRAGSIGIDINPRSDADVVHDLNHFPYPFSDNHFDIIYADNIIEHLNDVIGVMVELHRISKPNARISITVPHYAHRNANTDPTHKHFFGIHSFDYFLEGTSYSEFRYSSIQFKLQYVEFNKGLENQHGVDKVLTKIANMNKDFYENRLINIFPLVQLTFELQVVK